MKSIHDANMTSPKVRPAAGTRISTPRVFENVVFRKCIRELLLALLLEVNVNCCCVLRGELGLRRSGGGMDASY